MPRVSASNGDAQLIAGRHLSILAAQQSQQSDSSSQRSGTSIGLMPGLSARFTLFGQNAAAQDGSQHASESVTSALSATGGNLSLKAGTAGAGAAGSGTVTVQGADLLAQDRVSIRGTEVDLQAVANKSAAQSHTQSKATTVGAALTGTVGSLLTKISDQIETARHTDDDRLQAAAALKAGYDAYKLGSALASEGGAANLAEGVNSGAAIGVSISMNVSKSRSDSQQSQSQVRGSNIQAGSIAIQATQGDISAQSAKLQAQSISLDAKRDILLGAAANQSDIKSSNKSSSVGGGVTLGVGEQSGISFQLSASQTKGRVNGSETVYDNSQLIASDSLQLKSGRDTTLAGAQLGGDQVKLDVGGDLKLQTLQDQSLYDSKQSTSGFNLSVCVPPICAGTFVTGSINIAKQTISQNYLSAVGQSGITAGSQGFDIRVGGHTDLQGAAITSSAEDKDKNRLQTGSLSSADLANHQHTSAKSMSVSVGYQGASTGATLVANAVTNVLSNALGQAGLPKNKHEQSQTQSVISPARITITSGDAASQETATQLTSRDASTANQSLTNTFGLQQAQAVEAELNKQRAAKQAMQELAKDFAKEIGDHAAGKIEEAKALELRAGKEPDQAKSAELRQQAQQLRSDWGDYGTLRVAAHTALGGLTGDLKGAAGALAGTLAAPAVAEALDKAGVNAVLTTQLTRLVSTAAGAAVGGTAGGAAARNEVENNYLSHKQWNDLAQERANCKGDTRCEKRVETDYAKLSKAQDAVLATCDVRGDCAKLIGEVDAGRQRQLDLVKSGQLPDNFLGAYDLQSMGQKLATDTTLRGKVAQAVTTQLICDTNRALCDERSAKAAGGLVLTLAGVGAAAQLIKNVPALAAAAGMTVETCMSSLVLCASRVGVAVADLMAGDALGGASLAAGTLAAGKVAGKLTGKLADEAADAARNAAKVAEEAAALKAHHVLPNLNTPVYSEAQARALGGEKKGLIYVAETPRGGEAAKDFQAGTSGAFSDLATQKPAVPALRYDNPSGVNHVKFDGIEVAADGSTVLLVDAKTKLAVFNAGAASDTLGTLVRVKKALEQNPGYQVVYEFPNQAAADVAEAFFKKNDINFVVPRVREKP